MVHLIISILDNLQGNSLFSGALLVFMSHSTLLDKSLRLTLLEDLVSQLVRQQILQAEVKISKQVMQSALKNWSPRGCKFGRNYRQGRVLPRNEKYLDLSPLMGAQ